MPLVIAEVGVAGDRSLLALLLTIVDGYLPAGGLPVSSSECVRRPSAHQRARVNFHAHSS